jgi:hypothetical protein
MSRLHSDTVTIQKRVSGYFNKGSFCAAMLFVSYGSDVRSSEGLVAGHITELH